MANRTLLTLVLQALFVALIAGAPASAQGRGARGGMMGDSAHAADMQLFHQLFEHRAEIDRKVIKRDDGIETVTESKNPTVAGMLKAHVASMLARVKEARPIHQRDPLFVELFKHADKITATSEVTAGGVRVIETSTDAYVVKLLQAHADVVSAFLANGMSEMMKNHPVPQR